MRTSQALNGVLLCLTLVLATGGYSSASAQQQRQARTRITRTVNTEVAQVSAKATAAAATAPTNDRCENAQKIGGAEFPFLSRTVDLAQATTQGDPATSCLNDGVAGRTVWYTFTPPSDGSYVISTCDDAPTETTVADTFLNLYTSSSGCGGSLTPVPTSPRQGLSGCDDDGCNADTSNQTATSNQAVIISQLTRGVTYYILAGENSASADPIAKGGESLLQLRVQPAAAVPLPGQVVISEFRLSGNGKAGDEFVELFNNTDAPLSLGFLKLRGVRKNAATGARSLVDSFIFSKGTTIPPRSYYLVGDPSNGYSLIDYAVPDSQIYLNEGVDFDDNQGLALVLVTQTGSVIREIDKVGFAGGDNTTFNFIEGTGLTAYQTPTNKEYSFVRRNLNGYPQDTNNNAADFVLVTSDGEALGAMSATLGAPGPQSATSPRRKLAGGGIVINQFDSRRGFFSAPNNEVNYRDKTANGSARTLTLRRRFVNTTGRDVTELRVRILGLTTKASNAPTGADVRLISSVGGRIKRTDKQVLDVSSIVLEEPSDEAAGGGVNSSGRVIAITLEKPLTATDDPKTATIQENAVDVELRFAIERGGFVRYVYTVEAKVD